MKDLHERWPHRWITPKAETRPSPKHGIGVFALKPIKKGANVAVFGGIVVPKEDVREYWKKVAHIGIQISDDFFIVPSTREEVEKGGVFNHGCEPNCGLTNTFTLIAIKDVEVDEELVLDYAFCETCMEDFDCNCGAKTCRKIITERDWQIKEIQQKYREYYSPYLKSKI